MKNYCELCGNKNLTKVLDLGSNPLCDDLIVIGSNKKNILYKIVIMLCMKCLTAHQKYQVKKKILFPKKYHYRARFTDDVLKGMKNLVNETEKISGILKNKTVLDIGCNDGSLLNFFNKKGCKTIGVEPTNACIDVNKKKHIIYKNYFDASTVIKIKRKFKKIDIITFTNVFAHIEDLQGLIKNLKKIINEKTILVIENHYMGAVLKNKQFDTFYHEHPRTYSFRSFIYISKMLGLDILKVDFPKRYGGNIRITMGKSTITKVKNYKNIHVMEKKFLKSFKDIGKKIKLWKNKKRRLIHTLVNQYGKIPAKAFPGRAAILIKILGLNERFISAVYEKPNSMKIGHYVPGTKIPIKSDKLLIKKLKKEKVILNLAWHISGEIKKYLKKKNFNGKIVDILHKNDFR